MSDYIIYVNPPPQELAHWWEKDAAEWDRGAISDGLELTPGLVPTDSTWRLICVHMLTDEFVRDVLIIPDNDGNRFAFPPDGGPVYWEIVGPSAPEWIRALFS